jgi:hypothetical protein
MVLIKAALRRRAGASAPPRVHTRGFASTRTRGRRRGPRTGDVSIRARRYHPVRCVGMMDSDRCKLV